MLVGQLILDEEKIYDLMNMILAIDEDITRSSYTPTPRTHQILCPHSGFGMIPTKSTRIISGSILYLWTYMNAVRFSARLFITPKVSRGCPCDSSRR